MFKLQIHFWSWFSVCLPGQQNNFCYDKIKFFFFQDLQLLAQFYIPLSLQKVRLVFLNKVFFWKLRLSAVLQAFDVQRHKISEDEYIRYEQKFTKTKNNLRFAVYLPKLRWKSHVLAISSLLQTSTARCFSNFLACQRQAKKISPAFINLAPGGG